MPVTRYVLDQKGKPIPEPNEQAWWAWMQQERNRVAAKDKLDEVHVLTVFLGLDHNPGGRAQFWETMVFCNGWHARYTRRYSSRRSALRGHSEVLALLHARGHGGASQAPEHELRPELFAWSCGTGTA